MWEVITDWKMQAMYYGSSVSLWEDEEREWKKGWFRSIKTTWGS